MIALLLATLIACNDEHTGAPELVYDRLACAHCGMVVSEPRFAAQLVTADDEVLAFDDPACLVRYITEKAPSLKNTWFRDSTSREDRWVSMSEVGFVAAAGAPMNGGWAAVPVGTPGAVSFGEMSSRVLTGAVTRP